MGKKSGRDEFGRFLSGHNLAGRPRGSTTVARSTESLVDLVDSKLHEFGARDTVNDCVAECVCKLIEAAKTGDQTAQRWLVERFYPRERAGEARFQGLELPKPSQNPLGYLDAIVAAVADGSMTTSQAGSMAMLVRPFLGDEAFRGIQLELDALRARVEQLIPLRAVS